MQIPGNACERAFHKGCIVAQAIVCGISQYGHCQLLGSVSFDQRTCLEFGTDRGFGELLGGNRSDNAMTVAGRYKVNRNCTDHLDHLLQ